MLASQCLIVLSGVALSTLWVQEERASTGVFESHADFLPQFLPLQCQARRNSSADLNSAAGCHSIHLPPSLMQGHLQAGFQKSVTAETRTCHREHASSYYVTLPSGPPRQSSGAEAQLRHRVASPIAGRWQHNMKLKFSADPVSRTISKADKRDRQKIAWNGLHHRAVGLHNCVARAAPAAGLGPRLVQAMEVIAGRPRSPLMPPICKKMQISKMKCACAFPAKCPPIRTTHLEFGVRMIIDLDACFFSPRLGSERQRLCQEVQKDERVLVAFAGCGPEVLQLLSHTEAAEVVAVELNAAAVRCLRRSLEMMRLTTSDGTRYGRASVLEGDVRELACTLPSRHYHRILAPRPKNPGDGDLDLGDGGTEFLDALLPLLKDDGVCHWYDFAADWELPACERTSKILHDACRRHHRTCHVARVAAANRRTIAERQYRVVADFKVFGCSANGR